MWHSRRIVGSIVAACLIALSLGWPTAAAAAQQASTPSTDNRGPEANSQSDDALRKRLANELRALLPAPDLERQLAALIPDLGQPSYAARVEASESIRKLAGLTPSHLAAFRTAATDPETRLRLQMISDWLSQPNLIRHQCELFTTIQTHSVTGLADAIVDALPAILDQNQVIREASRALEVTATADDFELLAGLAADAARRDLIRAAALRALVRLDWTSEKRALVDELAAQPSGELGLEVARELARRRDLRAVEVLLALASDSNPTVASRAWMHLRCMAPDINEFPSLFGADSRLDALHEVRELLLADGVALNFDLESAPMVLGRILLADYENNMIYEFDEAGNSTWSQTVASPFACQGLPNGHRLVSHFRDQKVVEYDDRGEVVATFDELSGSPTCVHRLENGETLICIGHQTKAIQIFDADGEPVRTIAVEGNPVSVEPLEDNHLLVTLFQQSAIVLLDDKGDVVLKFDVKGQPYHATQLDSGNFLVAFCNDNKFVEYTRDGTEVETTSTEGRGFRVQQLPDGTVLFNGGGRISRRFSDGTTLPMIEGDEFGSTLYFHYY